MADLTYAQALTLAQSDPLKLLAMLLSGKQPNGTVIDSVGGGSLSLVDDGTVDATLGVVPTGFYNGTTTKAVSSANPMPVSGVLSATDAIPVSGGGIVVPVTVTIDVAAYSIGDSFGYAGGTTTDGWKITDAMRVDGGSGLITSFSMISLENIKPTGTVYVFSEAPVATITNNAAPTFSSSDDGHCIGKFVVASTDWASFGTARAIYSQDKMSLGVRCSTGKDLYFVFLLDNAPDYSAATTLYGYVGIGQF